MIPTLGIATALRCLGLGRHSKYLERRGCACFNTAIEQTCRSACYLNGTSSQYRSAIEPQALRHAIRWLGRIHVTTRRCCAAAHSFRSCAFRRGRCWVGAKKNSITDNNRWRLATVHSLTSAQHSIPDRQGILGAINSVLSFVMSAVFYFRAGVASASSRSIWSTTVLNAYAYHGFLLDYFR